ncbi:MAG: hypothetical protein AAF789_04530 [Bacteroidota bacterium]
MVIDENIPRTNISNAENGGVASAGINASALGDVNGDGIDDFILGGPEDSPFESSFTFSTGSAFVLFGNTSFGDTLRLADLDGSNGFTVEGSQNLRDFGLYVDGAGDFNQDGLSDILIGGRSTFNDINGLNACLIYGK